jgi:FkbM family methyltransferase
MEQLFIQYDICSHNQGTGTFYVVNRGEKKNALIVVLDGNYNIPITLYGGNIFPGMKYWFSCPLPEDLLHNPKFGGFKYLVIDNDSGEKTEIPSPYQQKKEVDINLPNVYLFGDSFYSYYTCLYTNKFDYIFENKYEGWFIDAGANLGSYTSLSIKKGVEKCLLIEPTPELANSLRLTFDKFKDIIIEECAVTNRDEDTVSFKTYTNKTYSSVGNLVSEDGEIVVKNHRIADLIRKYNIDKISLLKIDIEGSEYEVIMGLEDWIFDMTSSISLETHLYSGGDDSHLVEKIISHGFIYQLISKSELHGEHFFYKDKNFKDN